MASDQPAPTEPEKPFGPPMTDEERAELNDQLGRLVAKVTKGWLGGGRFFLIFTEVQDDGPPRMMQWYPETDDEIRRANFLYDASHGFGAFARQVKPGKPVRRTAEHNAFINGILANREDDTGYLAYADYLTELGDSQGDYIRACVQRSRLPDDHPDAKQLDQQIDELLKLHGEEWFAALGELGVRPEFRGHFVPFFWLSRQYGLIETVVVDRPGILPENADRLFAAAPFLRKLEFEEGHLDPIRLAKVKQLTQIEELDLGGTYLPRENLQAFLKSKYLTKLKSLDLHYTSIGDVGMTVLVAWPGLTKLDTLNVEHCSLTAVGMNTLAQCKNLANLRCLRASRNENTAATVAAIIRSPHLKQITELELGDMAVDYMTAMQFEQAAFAGTLEKLDLTSATFQLGALSMLTRAALPALSHLTLNSVEINAANAGSLARAVWRGTLIELNLELCRFGADAMEAFAAGKFSKLTTLDLSRNSFGTRGASALASAAKRFPSLKSLKLWDNKLTPQAVESLAKSAILANITNLELNDNKIGPTGALALANSKYLKKLTSLTVEEKTIGKKGKQALLDRFGENVVSFR